MPKTKTSKKTPESKRAIFNKLCEEFIDFDSTEDEATKDMSLSLKPTTIDYLVKIHNGRLMPEFDLQYGTSDKLRLSVYQKFEGEKRVTGVSIGGRFKIGKKK